MMGLAAASVVLLLLLSALLTAAHEAVARIAPSNVRTLQEEGFEGASALAAIREDGDAARIGVRLTTTLLDLATVGVVALTGVSTWGAAGPVVSTAVGIALVLVCADLVPHAVAARRPVRIALSSAPTLLRVTRSLRPLAAPVARLGDVGSSEDAANTQHRELLELQEIGEEEGVLEESENQLVERAFRLDELTAWDVMVPRVDIFAWKEGLTLDDIRPELGDVPHSRVPVYNESIDDVTGILYVREAYERIARGEGRTTLGDIAREPFFVPRSLPLTRLLQDFQARRIHLGIVADEFGGTDGLVTLEDVVEELVGEIHDETDIEEEEIHRISENAVECDAGADIRDIDEALGIDLPKAEHRSLNGFILEELGHVPTPGEALERSGVRIEVLEATETQVVRARITKLPGDEAAD